MTRKKPPDPVPSSQVDAVWREIQRMHLDVADPLAVLAVHVAERVDAGQWTAADVRELRLTILGMRQSSAPAAGGDELDRLRRQRRRPPGAAG